MTLLSRRLHVQVNSSILEIFFSMTMMDNVSVCVETRATAWQVLCGAWLPYASTLAGYVMIGKGLVLKWVPGPDAGKAGFKNLFKL